MMNLRCENGILFGTLEDGVLEVKCRSRRCGHRAGVVVLHQFDILVGPDGQLTGELKGTKQFKDPTNREETCDEHSSLRSA